MRNDHWHVDRIEVENFRGFPAIGVDLDPELTVLVGLNGSGKTALLDAIAIALSPVVRAISGSGKNQRNIVASDARLLPRDLESATRVAGFEAAYPVCVDFKGKLGGMESESRRQLTTETGRTTRGDSGMTGALQALHEEATASDGATPVLPVIATYGVERLADRRADGKIAVSRFGAYDSCLDSRSDLTRLSGYIQALSFEIFSREGAAPAARRQLSAIQQATRSVLRPTGWTGPEWSQLSGGLQLRHPTRGTQPLGWLSTGTKIAAGLVIDLASRLARANPSLGGQELLDQASGIVLIDEVDLHLHPEWQQQIVPLLRSTFPGVQFVVTTHSPQVLSTVAAEHIRILTDDPPGIAGVEYSAGLRTDKVLQSVLGTNPAPRVPERIMVEEYMALVYDGKAKTPTARRLRDALEDEVGDHLVLPELASADAEIALGDLLAE